MTVFEDEFTDELEKAWNNLYPEERENYDSYEEFVKEKYEEYIEQKER